jgi:hypothetical protein
MFVSPGAYVLGALLVIGLPFLIAGAWLLVARYWRKLRHSDEQFPHVDPY